MGDVYFRHRLMRNPVSSIAVGVVLVASLGLHCRRVEGVEESPAQREALKYLVDYLRIDTSNPPGRETAAARYLESLLRAAGLDAQLVGSDPARRSVYARIKSGSNAPALLLLHHLDVVPATASEWSIPPFSGEISGGYVWGRGALDIKSLGIAQLMAVIALKRSGAALKRDVVFLGVADEEAGGLHGARKLLEENSELFSNVGFVLNEGGANETVVDRVRIWGIEIDQKTPLWIRISTKGRRGHGAAPPDDGGSAARLVDALTRLLAIRRDYRLVPSIAGYFSFVSRTKSGLKAEMLRDPSAYFDSPDFSAVLSPSYRALLRDTMVITQIHAGDSTNSVPGRSWADVDLRLLPDRPAENALAEIRAALPEGVEIETLLLGEPSPPSEVNTELFAALRKVMEQSEPGSVAGPLVLAGTTDSRFFRSRGIVAYGISPFKVNYYDADSIHGVDERIRVKFFHEGVGLIGEVVREFAVERK